MATCNKATAKGMCTRSAVFDGMCTQHHKIEIAKALEIANALEISKNNAEQFLTQNSIEPTEKMVLTLLKVEDTVKQNVTKDANVVIEGLKAQVAELTARTHAVNIGGGSTVIPMNAMNPMNVTKARNPAMASVIGNMKAKKPISQAHQNIDDSWKMWRTPHMTHPTNQKIVNVIAEALHYANYFGIANVDVSSMLDLAAVQKTKLNTNKCKDLSSFFKAFVMPIIVYILPKGSDAYNEVAQRVKPRAIGDAVHCAAQVYLNNMRSGKVSYPPELFALYTKGPLCFASTSGGGWEILLTDHFKVTAADIEHSEMPSVFTGATTMMDDASSSGTSTWRQAA